MVFKNNGNIRHVFFHSLVADTDRAFDGDFDSFNYNLYMTTISEFNAILEQMYARGYVLISPYDMVGEVTDETGTHFAYKEIRLPEGKIPFLMSQDDLNYYAYMVSTDDGHNKVPEFVNERNDGFAHKIVIGEDGYPTCEYMQKDGTIVTGDYDLVPLLERFIQAHPDFSYHGARAMLGVTGYEGVFGYRTNPNYRTAMGDEAFEKEVADAKAVAQCLKDHGWLVVSHSYGHPAYGEISAERVERDSTKWEETVQPIVGETDILIFPYGSDIHNWRPIPADNEKFVTLYEDGYRYFFNVDSNVWNQVGENHFRGGRLNLDGYVLYHKPWLVEEFFDVETVFDKARPTPVPTL
ncbi:MAG: polysaccharide deacetylase [Ruminococcaceae bacterium]|nr:polysaccharide deacetylase [Oscillospiraceae bacterium]